jgi:plasmid maintenance system antidote protein VapI
MFLYAKIYVDICSNADIIFTVDKIMLNIKQKGSRLLREYMRKKGMRRQHELAVELNLSDATISLYLNGIRSFSPDTAMRVSAKTGIPLEALFQ